ncbi:hypothetical protein CAMGR0001_0375 [Campylobacter gracilis RM3268]|uniref:Uncharacterized protein n=1 Tax=Campylobacter gracilis RM3268 TaxID=553220 RepID=C8PHD1_9BACT|nr:hypothetical protein CAMGR0001_0375 [Campylobacter gracilis RM3268]
MRGALNFKLARAFYPRPSLNLKFQICGDSSCGVRQLLQTAISARAMKFKELVATAALGLRYAVSSRTAALCVKF